MKADSNYHKYLFTNIVLSRGDTIFERFLDMIDKEIIILTS
jgi:hypothetical protein